MSTSTGKSHWGEWLAWGISLLAHPIFIPFYAVLLYFYLSPYYYYDFAKILKLIFIQAILVPFILLYLLFHLKILRSFFLSSVRARLYFSFFMAIIYFTLHRSVAGIASLDELSVFFLGIAVSLLIAGLFNLTGRRISLHLLAMGGTLIFFGYWSWIHRHNILDILSIMVGLTGLLAVARYALRAHTLTELALGWLSGMAGMGIAIWLH